VSSILNTVSVIGSFCVTFGLLYFFMNLTIGFIPLFKKELFGKIALGDIVFPIVSLLIIMVFIDFYRPY